MRGMERWRRLAGLIAGLLALAPGPAPAQESPTGPAPAPAPLTAEDLAEVGRRLGEVWALIDRGRYEKAQGDLDALADEITQGGQPVPHPVHAALAMVRAVRGDEAGAIAAWDRCLALEPAGPRGAEARRRRADLELRTGDVDGARADYQAARQAWPHALAAVVGLAELEELRGDRKAAEALYRQAIAHYNDPAQREAGLDPNSVAALTAAGRAAEGLGRTAGAAEGKAVGDGDLLQQAKRAYEGAQRLVERQPPAEGRDFECYLRAGRLFAANHNEAQAASYYRDVLKFNRSHPDAQAGMAAAFELNWGRQEQARLHAERALDVNRRCALAHLVLGKLAATAENYEEAIGHCDRALAVSGWDAEARALRAACCHVLGQEDEFQREADRYAIQHVGDGGVPHAVAAVLEDQRRFDEAAEWEQKALAIDPVHWGAWVNRGMNLLRVGDEEEGKKALEEGFRHYQYDVHAFNMLKLLQKLDGFVTRETDHFRMRFDPGEEEVMAPYCAALLERGWADLKIHYGGFEAAGPILFEMFPQAQDFAVRTLGLPGLGALGACFGKVVTIDSPKAVTQPGPDGQPRPAFNWGATAWHEFAHVVTLQLSNGRVPRWFTEGLSEFEEREHRPEWTRPLDEKLHGLWRAGRLTPIDKLNNDFMGGDIGFAYFYAGWICRFLAETRGRPAIVAMLKAYGEGHRTEQVLADVLRWSPAEFDTKFREWLGGHLGAWRLPAWYGEEDRAALKRELDARPDDAALVVKLARAYWQARNVADAEIHAGRAAELDPQNGEALFIWSEIARAKRSMAAAERRLKLAFARGFDDHYVRLRLAELAEGADDQAALIGHLEAAHRYFPRARGDGSPAKRLATLYAQAGRADDARAMRAHAVALVPEDLDGREALLEEHRQRGDRESVLQYCEEINHIDPFRFEHHLVWSTTLREVGRLAEAVREGEVAKLVAEQVEDKAMNQGQHDPAMAVATGRACAVLGLAYVAQRALDGARDLLEVAQKRAPEAAETAQLAAALAAAEAPAPGDGGGSKDGGK